MTEPGHVPVLLDRVVALVAPALDHPGSVLVDATLGLGGHTAAILSRCPQAHVVGLDRDADALALARAHLAERSDRLTAVHAVFDEMPDVLRRLGLSRVDGVLFDLGVSSLQLDDRRRGFAYAEDAPLDMRMDPSRGVTAADVVNTYSAAELAGVLRTYGEERFARRIAGFIVRERSKAPFVSSARLVEVLRAAIPAATRSSGGHPAKRTFQALRIEVNDELASLQRALPAAIAALATGGRIVVLAYHSLEDRLVKKTFAARSRADVPAGLPVVPAGHEPELRLLTRGAEKAGAAEIAANPRARSVRLRAAERVREAA
jgi:16S rRNA (cytosine1402-N4)-methyltransferase